jgi:hypothetical protein
MLAADAVVVERVSAAKFPANREKNREYLRTHLFSEILKAYTRATSAAYSVIPYATEQGTFSAEQGILAQEQGILSGKSKR